MKRSIDSQQSGMFWMKWSLNLIHNAVKGGPKQDNTFTELQDKVGTFATHISSIFKGYVYFRKL